MRIWAVFLLLLVSGSAVAEGHYPENEYQSRWCTDADGLTEVVLPDGTRCDCLTETHAVEVDFGRKWAESIGQALLYGELAHRRPGVVLVLETQADVRGLTRLRQVVRAYKLPIDVWTVQKRRNGYEYDRKAGGVP